MTVVAPDDAWMEVCLVGIANIDINSGADMQFAALTETIDFDLGEKDIEGVPLVNGGRITKFNPEGDKTVTFEAYPLQAGTDTGSTGLGFFDLMHDQDTAVPIRITNTRTRNKSRILVLWTNDPTPTTAQAATAQNYSALRIGLAEGYVTSVKPSFTDGILKFTVTYKCAAFQKDGTGNVIMESAVGSSGADVLPAIAAYTTANIFG